jgi:hypothetical protein
MPATLPTSYSLPNDSKGRPESALVYRPIDAPAWTSALIDQTFGDITDFGDDGPGELTREAAKRMLRAVENLVGRYALPATIEAFEGDMLLYWKQGDRAAVFVVPHELSRTSKLYREWSEEGIKRSTLVSTPTAFAIALAIVWVRQ